MAGLGLKPGTPIALAVSGGGDSAALMHLVSDWLRETGSVAPPSVRFATTSPVNGGGKQKHASSLVSSPACGGGAVRLRGGGGATVLTVDHGLREGSRKEAALVRQWAQAVGLDAYVLRWRGPRPKSNIEEKARAARYRLMGQWCRAHGIDALLVAHTLEDQAETFLLRLGRGSGVDGLSAMRPKADFPLEDFADIALHRPLLTFGRAELRADLVRREASWLEDPMNEDPRFARVRIRRLLPQLEAAGISPARIAAAAAHLGRAREALDRETAEFLAGKVRFAPGCALLDGDALRRLHPEVGLRVVSRVLMRVSGAPYRPRFERLERLLAALTEPGSAARTLQGCRIGKAPKGRAAFGPATLEIVPEKPRRAGASAGKRRKAVRPPSKSPQKGRNVGLTFNS